MEARLRPEYINQMLEDTSCHEEACKRLRSLESCCKPLHRMRTTERYGYVKTDLVDVFQKPRDEITMKFQRYS